MMQEITVEESKELQLRLLSRFHDFCEENGLSYLLAYGTLLGAVRHQGFIPWDDDIDVFMPREDYRIFLKEFGERDFCKAISCETDPEYYLPFAKVMDTRTGLQENISGAKEIGVYIDVFPMDTLSEEERKNRGARKKILLCRNLLSLKILPGSQKRKGWKRLAHAVLSRLLFFTNMNRISCYMNCISASLGEKGKALPLASLANTDTDDICRAYSADFFAKRALYPFEGESFYGPEDFNSYLKKVYGDYMQLPPEEERISKHEYTQYWKNT